jgi:regulator of sirC expression with transglutaminase-like and TPR domain
MDSPVYCRPAAFSAFAAELPEVDSTSGLFRAAFAIALHELPEANLSASENTLAGCADLVRRRALSDSPQAKIAHLHDVLFDVIGLRGNTEDYYDPSNSYLPAVVARHRGIPITLVLVYKYVAEQLGITVHGINAPGHFLAEVECPEGESERSRGLMYVDPFYGGDLLNREEVLERVEQATGKPVLDKSLCLARATHRQWLSRMLNNLQASFAATGRDRDVYAMQELQALL